MLILTADDYGRSVEATDRICLCGARGRITSASAMVFMRDSVRAAARAADTPLEFGLHFNFTEPMDDAAAPASLRGHHDRVRSFLNSHRMAPALYAPRLAGSFRVLVDAQREEYERLFGTAPAFYNGHHHMHLCTNVLLGHLLPTSSPIRNAFTFEPGEKSLLNRLYRKSLRRWIRAHHTSTNAFYSIEPIHDISRLTRLVWQAGVDVVEIEVHPERHDESQFLLGDSFAECLKEAQLGSFGALVRSEAIEPDTDRRGAHSLLQR
jgi:predicted glycoside hydrolase/deacetylase ChbG (UPF0249 family)